MEPTRNAEILIESDHFKDLAEVEDNILMDFKAVKKFPLFYRNRKLITVFITGHK
jgi:hypothetical protein